MRFPRWWIGLALLPLWFGGLGSAAEPEVNLKELPHFPPVEPNQTPATFRVKPGFHVELVASEPLVVDPIAMSFDENGRLYVVEMRDYSERRDERLGRIRLLEDTDGDGRFDKSTVFAEGLAWPTAVICYGGGVFVGATPDVYYLKDTNGDGVADTRETVFTGFGSSVERLNVQQLFNSFTWGLDNRIHGATGANGGVITNLSNPNIKPLDLRGRDFTIEPRSRTMASESGGGQYGLSFDSRGRKFVCSNSSHIQLVMYEERYGGRNPFYAMPPVLAEIAVDGPAAEVYRISPDEPWRVIRTRWRVAGLVPGPIEGGGRPSGYFTGATGITIYRGDAWPSDYRDNAFVADCGSNLAHRKVLSPDGASLRAARAPDEQKVEFLASTDTWFRPVQFANAPDGTLYVIDMYREIIEHPWSLPQSLKKHLDLNSGNDRGRIYRIVPDGFRQPKPPRLGKASTRELVSTLANPNGWYRDTVARLIYERQDREAVPLLRGLSKNSPSALGRLHALYALDGMNALSSADIDAGLADADSAVREHAIRLSERFLSEPKSSTTIWTKLASLANDPDPRVRYQLAFTAGQTDRPERVQVLSTVVRHDADDAWTRAATLSSSAGIERQLFAAATADTGLGQSAGGQRFLAELGGVIGARDESAAVNDVLDYAAQANEPGLAFSLARALGEGLQRGGHSLSQVDALGKLARIQSLARDTALDGARSEPARLEAIQLLGMTRFDDVGPLLISLLKTSQSEPLQFAVIDALARFRDARVSAGLLQQWAYLTPGLRGKALTALLSRSDRVGALLAALEKGEVLRSELSSTQIKLLREHRDPTLRAQAARILGDNPARARQDVINAYLPALNLVGQPAHGRAIYLERCAQCHRLAGQGSAVGPDLASVKSSGKETMLTNVLDPNREVAPRYLNYLVETKDGQSLSGLVAAESAGSVTLRRANGDESVILRSNLERLRSLGQSLMPEGLEAGLKPQDVADLLEYIVTAE